jgi:hypothetical protein
MENLVQQVIRGEADAGAGNAGVGDGFGIASITF